MSEKIPTNGREIRQRENESRESGIPITQTPTEAEFTKSTARRKIPVFENESADSTRDLDSKNNQPENTSTEAENVMSLDVSRLLAQADRLIALTRRRRESAGYSDTETRDASDNFVQLRRNIRLIKNRLHKIASEEATAEQSQEIQELRSELAGYLKGFKNEFPQGSSVETREEIDMERLENDVLESLDHLSPEEKHDAIAWGNFSDALTKVPQSESENPVQKIETEVETKTEAEIELNPKVVEYFNIKKEYQAKKEAFEDGYRKFLEESEKERNESHILKKFSMGWSKKEYSEELQKIDHEFQNARIAYGNVLNTKLGARAKRSIPDTITPDTTPYEKLNESNQASLANRFVLVPAQSKFEIEKALLDGRSNQLFEKMKGILRLQGKKIGYIATAGIGLATGGVVGALSMGGKMLLKQTVASTGQTEASAVSAMNAFAPAIAGGMAGAFVGKVGMDFYVNNRKGAVDSSAQHARRSYSLQSSEALEKAHLLKLRSLDSAVRNKKKVVAASAIVGAVGASVLSGVIDTDDILDSVPVEAPLDIDDFNTDLPVEDLDISPEVPGPVLSVPSTTELDVPSDVEVPIINPLGTEQSVSGVPESELLPESPHELLTQDQLEQQLGGGEVAPEAPAALEVTDAPVAEDVPPYPAMPSDEMLNRGSEVEHLFTFEPGSKVDTVSEALFEEWKAEPGVLAEDLTKKEFLAQMYTAIADIEKNPLENTELMEQMGITSGDIDKVFDGQEIDLQPFFEYLNNNQ